MIYGEKLFKAYHPRPKIFQTLELAEACGINTLLTNPALCDVTDDYWRHGGKIQFISDCGVAPLIDSIQKSIDHGARACYIMGGIADPMVQKQQFDQIAKALELMRRNGLPAGIGGHPLKTIKECVEKGIKPDFWIGLAYFLIRRSHGRIPPRMFWKHRKYLTSRGRMLRKLR